MAITKDARVFRSQTTKEWDEAACSKASEIRKSMDETSQTYKNEAKKQKTNQQREK